MNRRAAESLKSLRTIIRTILGITLDTTAALIRISARNNFWGFNVPVIVIVRDQGGLSCSDTLFISVLPVNDPPRVLTLPDSTALAGTPYASLVHAQDVDDGDDGITFTLSGSTWISIDSTGKISGVPSRAGIEEIRLIVSDPWGAADTALFKMVIHDVPREIPSEYVLSRISESVNPATTLRFGLPEPSTVLVEVYNMIGQRVAELLNSELEPGYHEIRWSPSNLASGAYIVFFSTKGLVSANRQEHLVKKVSYVK